MSYTILIACLAAGWAFLSLLGSAEKARRDAEAPAETPPPVEEEPAA